MTEPYTIIIGLEVHVQLLTQSKMFCGCSTAFGSPPNTQTCPVCIGLPGSLPVMNREAFELALKTAVALNCTIPRFTKWDRKQYYYPDLPKGYQISQFDLPLSEHGYLPISDAAGQFEPKNVRIIRAHLEEDAGKSMHDELAGKADSRIDLNRTGTPLLEIVSEPDLRSAEEALAYLEKLRSILQFLGVSDCRMQEGSLRADVNVSVRPAGSQTLGTRTEMKNMNSFKAIGRAIATESKRQIELLEEGRPVRQETRRWDDNKDASFAMRSKEDAQDYRYFPDPDLVAVRIGEDWISDVAATLPELPESRRQRYQNDWGLSAYDAQILTGDPALAALQEQTVALCGHPKEVASWIMGEFLQSCKENECEPQDLHVPPTSLSRLVVLVGEGVINRSTARKVFQQIWQQQADPDAYIDAHNLRMVSSPEALRQAIEQVLAANPQSLADYRSGKTQALTFLVGQVMRAMQGKANPALLNQMLTERLKET
ncbi:MAG TPA: Asp-tRNA(Asn)/Glu-tRNA(Gln) amidotransferase GatCAB subunit B [Clostridiales bacterium]|nr:Asp-tRNA(Asn)/Glu-tRNA(Gln) amidotransferase GatCAB subunit B [Clostridiales bacterium]